MKTSFQMELDPALPCGLCRTCSDDTLAAITFKNLCAQSAHHWTEGSTYLTQVYPPTEEDKAYFIFYNEDKTIVKDQIDRVPTTKDAADRLNLKYTIPEPEKVRKPRQQYSSKKACKCPDCGKKFSTPEYLNYHLRNTLKRACRECRLIVPKKKLAKHLASQHGINLHECNACFKLFVDEDLMKKHVEVDHRKLAFSCHHCGNSYVSERALRAHAHAHSLFHCAFCNRSYENIKCYKYHRNTCEFLDRPSVQFKNFTCDHCGVTYNRKPSLRIHIIQKHLNVLPYVCQTCGKRTSTLAHLRSHEKTHVPERRVFQCGCGAQLRTELGFQLHLRIHTGERPYKCEHCGDRFLSSSRRLDHIKRRHRGASDFKHACDQCTARFVRPCELKKHYLSVHYSVVEVMPAKREVNPVTRRFRNTIEKDI